MDIVLKMKAINKILIIFAFITFAVVAIMYIFNPIRLEKTSLVESKIGTSLKGNIIYTFELNEYEKYENELPIQDSIYVDYGDTVMVRYLINDPNVNSINIYRFIYYREIQLFLVVFSFLAIGFGGYFTCNMILRSSDLSLEGVYIPNNVIMKTIIVMIINGIFALMGAISLLGGVLLCVNFYKIPGIFIYAGFFIILGLFCIIHFFYLIYKLKK